MTDRDIINAYLSWVEALRHGVAGAKDQCRQWGEVLTSLGYSLAPRTLRGLLA